MDSEYIMKYRMWNVCKLTHILFCLISLLLVHAVSEADLKYNIKEEQTIGTYIGTIKSDFDIRSTISEDEYNNLIYNLFSTGNPYAAFFKINNRTSDLAVGSRIDRDSLSVCTFTAKCVLSVDVAVQAGGAFFRKLKVDITIEDLNDNSPRFSVNEVDVELAESTTGRSPASFNGALDADLGILSVQNYRVLEPNTPFGVQFEKLVDGSSIVNIIVQKGLDREKQDLYKLTVVAEDGGNPVRTGTLKVNVIITDVNDNAPKFTQSVYNVTVKEDIELGNTILTVSATDADIGENGEVVYKLSAHQIENVPSLFSINPVSGALSVVGQLVYVPNEIMRVFVEASDKGVPPKISQAVVYVNIEDSNNNAPQVNINILAGSDQARVSEYANIGTVVAHVGVVDDDTGRNGIVTCTGASDRFGLERLDVKEYKVVVTKPLDRELISVHIVDIFCHDNGSPPLHSSIRFNVEVLDENDVSPRFTQGTYFIMAEENNEISKVIIKVSAEDLDTGIYGQVTYILVDDGGLDFRISPNTGEIRANFVMDRENVSRVTLKVKAVDGGTNPMLSGEATVIITINDQNDNTPAFVLPEYHFVVEENTFLRSKVGQIVATDSDDGENGTVLYSLLSFPSSDFPFTLFSNGTIITSSEIDMEVKSLYDFRVVASDQGRKPLRSSVQVVISISDQNDNHPVFVFPKKDNNTVTVSYTTLSGTVITAVTANDADDGRNAVLSYSIIDKNVTDIFTMEIETGKIILKRKLTSYDPGLFTFKVKVEDHGNNRLSSSAYLTIAFSQALESNGGGDDNQHFLIAISLSCITVVLSVAIVLAICLIKRHDKLKAKEAGGHGMETKSGNTTLSLVLKGNQLKKVNLPLEYDTRTMTKEAIRVSLISQDVYQISDRLTLEANVTSSGTRLSSYRGQRTKSDRFTFNLHPQQLDPIRMKPLERSLVVSHEQISTNLREQHTPPLTKDIMKQHEDNGSESSGETTTSDSGRGGSEPDIQSSLLSSSHDHTDTTKSVKFESKGIFHHIETELTWKNQTDVSSIYPEIASDISSDNSSIQNNFSSSQSAKINDLLLSNSRNPKDYSLGCSRNSSDHQYILNQHRNSVCRLNTSRLHVYCGTSKGHQWDCIDTKTSPGDVSSVSFGTSYDEDEDEDSSTSGSYTIDADEKHTDSQDQFWTYTLDQNEAYC